MSIANAARDFLSKNTSSTSGHRHLQLCSYLILDSRHENAIPVWTTPTKSSLTRFNLTDRIFSKSLKLDSLSTGYHFLYPKIIISFVILSKKSSFEQFWYAQLPKIFRASQLVVENKRFPEENTTYSKERKDAPPHGLFNL